MRIRERIGIWLLELRDRLSGFPSDDYEQRKAKADRAVKALQEFTFFHGSFGRGHRELNVQTPKFHHWHVEGSEARPCITEIAPGERKECECGDMLLERPLPPPPAEIDPGVKL